MKYKLTVEEKARWQSILLTTCNAIAYDVIQCCGGEASGSEMREMIIDANRPMDFGMTAEEYHVLCNLSRSVRDKWMRTFLRGPFVV